MLIITKEETIPQSLWEDKSLTVMGDLLQVVKLPPVMKIQKKFTLPLGKASYQTPNCRALHAALTNPSLLFSVAKFIPCSGLLYLLPRMNLMLSV